MNARYRQMIETINESARIKFRETTDGIRA